MTEAGTFSRVTSLSKARPCHSGGSQAGGILVDWNLKSSLDGLFVAGMTMFSSEDHSYCAATGRYAGRKAAGMQNR